MAYNRDSVLKYREAHPDKWLLQNKKNQRAYYLRNKAELLAKMKHRKQLKQAQKIEIKKGTNSEGVN